MPHEELLEELGVTIQIDDEPFRIHDPAPDLTLHAWVVTNWAGDITNLAPEEHDEIGWFASVTFLALTSPTRLSFGSLPTLLRWWPIEIGSTSNSPVFETDANA
ncbi:hypothetical protein [Ilumatobacter nonamiensis]|uniref:hypothetical protein n=1 Tax=Ilumatobacter nonamiensis TaxID=467093 RepID=UPI000687BD46|nr:hypothetical protein [Ilumatobacter nonamiensis]